MEYLLIMCPKSNEEGVFYRVLAGSYNSRENAENQVRKLKDAGFDATIVIYNKEG